jgi:hypothetical protein
MEQKLSLRQIVDFSEQIYWNSHNLNGVICWIDVGRVPHLV